MPVAPLVAREVNLQRPFVPGGVIAAEPFYFKGDVASRERATDCLAAAGWYEGGDNASMESSVMQVVLNRASNPAFPASICGVVFQGSERSTGCQFTFSCDGSMMRRPSTAAWDRARRLAKAALAGFVDSRVGYATHYHGDWVVPYWARSVDKIAQVGSHIFYRWRGFWGEPKAFHLRPFEDAEPKIRSLETISPFHEGGTDPATIITLPVAAESARSDVALPTPIELPGVREKSLRGALVRGGTPTNTYFIQLDPGRFAGNYATAALAICKNRNACTVLGWTDPAAMSTSLPLREASGRHLTFYYHRDGQGERALWNCDEVKRSNPSQCLPPNVDLLTGLTV
jgi:hypothetical protein